MMPSEDRPKSILLVEDNDLIRKTARRILEGVGYVVLEAGDGSEGLTSWEANSDSIDLLLTDITMPKIDGRELALSVLKRQPRMKVIFMSGNLQRDVLPESIWDRIPFLQKPFTAQGLAEKIDESLNARAARS